jgi:ABC-2 type transport system ATP-binding protein
MWETIRDLVASGSTVLLTTQYLDEADQLADRIAVIDTGKVVAEGTADDLKALVGDSTLQLGLEAGTDAAAAAALVTRVVGVAPTLAINGSHLTVPLTDTGVVTDVLVRLRESGIQVTDMSLSKPSLDEVFLTITGHSAEIPQESAV